MGVDSLKVFNKKAALITQLFLLLVTPERLVF